MKNIKQNNIFFTRPVFSDTNSKHKTGLKNTSSAFTLVELIVVITILVILGTIAFISLQGFSRDARDVNRTSSIKLAQNRLGIYIITENNYPMPDNSVTLTGGNTTITQGLLGQKVAGAIKLMGDTKDPSTNNYYTYSTSGNGKYYQIRADLENTVSYNSLINTTYAERTQVLVKGDYSFDPSLPSLITITGSVNSSSGIFDPNVCFVIDGGTNLLTSNSTNCTKKKDMSLKDFDSALVGYWDMESLNGSKLKDLSGNGNDGTFSGTILPSNIGGYLGNGLLFSLGTINCGSGDTLYTKDSMTMVAIIKPTSLNNFYPRILQKGNPEYLFALNNDTRYSIVNSFGSNYYSNGLFTNYIAPSSINNTINLNNYYILTSTLNNKTSNLYLNGYKILTNTGTISHNNLFDLMKNTGNLYIGNSSINGGRQFNGIIDDIKIYNRTLSDYEITQQARIAGF